MKGRRVDFEALVGIVISMLLLLMDYPVLTSMGESFHGDFTEMIAGTRRLRPLDQDKMHYLFMNRAVRVQRAYGRQTSLYREAIAVTPTNKLSNYAPYERIVDIYQSNLAIALELSTNAGAADAYAVQHNIRTFSSTPLIGWSLLVGGGAGMVFFTARFIRRSCCCSRDR